MAKAISWVAVNKSGEVCLDSDPAPLPRGWERCLDLQSGVMYLKQMNTPSQSLNNIDKGQANNRGNSLKRKRLLFEDDDGEGDPSLQLTLSLPTYSHASIDSDHILSPQAQCFPSISAPSQAIPSGPSSMSHEKKRASPVCADDSATSRPSSVSESHSLIINGGPTSEAQATSFKELESNRMDATTSSNGSSPSCNASSSSSSSSPSSKYKQLSNGLRANNLGLGGLNKESSLIKATGCPHCFMYVLPSRNNPKCPRCKSPILVDLSPLTIH